MLSALWAHREYSTLAEGLLALKCCHWISYTPYKLWIRRLKQIGSLTSSTNVNFSFLTLVGSSQSGWQFVPCQHRLALTQSQKSKNEYHCTDTSLPGWRALWMTSAVIFSYIFFSLSVPSCVSLSQAFSSLLGFNSKLHLKDFLHDLVNLTSNESQTAPTKHWSSPNLCHKGHFYLRLISETLPDDVNAPLRAGCSDFSPSQSPGEFKEICWIQWTQFRWHTYHTLCQLYKLFHVVTHFFHHLFHCRLPMPFCPIEADIDDHDWVTEQLNPVSPQMSCTIWSGIFLAPLSGFSIHTYCIDGPET